MIEARVACLVECYTSDNVNATPTNQVWEAQWRGWDHPLPVLGVYGGKTLADFPTRLSYPGWSVYLAEYL